MNRWPNASRTSTNPDIRMKYHAASSKPPDGLRCLVIVVDLPPYVVSSRVEIDSRVVDPVRRTSGLGLSFYRSACPGGSARARSTTYVTGSMINTKTLMPIQKARR